jgi:adenosine deaminase
MRDLTTLPKAELHVHLEGGMRVATLRELADRDGLPLPTGLGDDDVWRFDDELDFIDQYVAACAVLRRLEDFERLGREVATDLAAQGVRYAEAVFSPSNHAERMGEDWQGPIEAVLDGLAAAERETGIVVRLTPDIVRDLGLEQAERVLEVALAFAGRGVIALNAAGSERAEVGIFAPMFRRAKEAGLRSVPHAGEWAGPANVRATLDAYEPDRIGHGVRSVDDASLVRELADTGIPLEVCPVSNVRTGVYPSLAAHPFDALRRAGVVVTLNSDDPPMFGAWLADVYRAARDTWGYDDRTMAEIARTGVAASFAEPERKESIQAEIDAWLRDTAGDPGHDGGSDLQDVR